ncbi:MAG: hypothetical protein ABSF09_13330 [Candidatus Bathyarchaeia archaeon]|jgi:hypothetical protein
MVDVGGILVAGAVSALVSSAIIMVKEFWVEPRKASRQTQRQWLQDQLRFVYGPLYSAVLSMKEGKLALPQGYTVGTPINAWSRYPEIMRRIIEIFSNYPQWVDNQEVWKVWITKEGELRKGEFWLGGEVYKWFDSIEREYDRIRLEARGRI